MNNTILLTGGHITPAVAVTQALKRMSSRTRIVLAGRTMSASGIPSVEREEIERVGGVFLPFSSGKVHRFVTVSQLKELWKIGVSFASAFRLIRRERPFVIVSFGGYLAFPFVVLAPLFNIPLVIHEQTTRWGAVNAIAQKWARTVAVSWPKMVSRGTTLTGNPMPDEVARAGRTSKSEERIPVLYITGGNQGSATIDEAVKPILPKLMEQFKIFHQSRNPLHDSDSRYTWMRWFPTPEHARILAQTTISVSRSGANTVTDLAYMGVPSILIPLSVSAGHEQARNAHMLVQTGLAIALPEQALTPVALLGAIEKLFSDRQQIQEFAAPKAKVLIIPDSADRLARIVLDCHP